MACRRTVMLALASFAAGAGGPAPRRVLRIAADPNNLPFTNESREESSRTGSPICWHARWAAEIQYVWRAQRRGFFREALKGGECDLVLGVPSGFERAATTAPYYRSTYVFVTRKDRGLDIRSFDDPRLKSLKIGVQLIGNDGANTPPAHVLASRGWSGTSSDSPSTATTPSRTRRRGSSMP